jgi:hypothetical protein
MATAITIATACNHYPDIISSLLSIVLSVCTAIIVSIYHTNGRSYYLWTHRYHCQCLRSHQHCETILMIIIISLICTFVHSDCHAYSNYTPTAISTSLLKSTLLLAAASICRRYYVYSCYF